MHFLNPCIDLTVYIVTTCTARNFCDGKTCSFAFTALSEIFWNRQYIIDVPVEQVILNGSFGIRNINQIVPGSQIIGQGFGHRTFVMVNDCNVEFCLFKYFIGICKFTFLYSNCNCEKNDNIHENISEISFCNCQKSFKYCHNVPSLLLRMQYQGKEHS